MPNASVIVVDVERDDVDADVEDVDVTGPRLRRPSAETVPNRPDLINGVPADVAVDAVHDAEVGSRGPSELEFIDEVPS